jgi:hypothetical protein
VFSKISVNKINNLRKVTTLKSSVEQKKYFFEKNTMQSVPKNKYHRLLADPPEVIGAFPRNCLRMQKAPIKFAKFGRWEMALVCGPGSRKHSPLPQSGLRIKPLPLTNGHGRYITIMIHPNGRLCPLGNGVTFNRYGFVTVSIPKRFRNGRFNSETATWIQKWFKISV